MQLDRKWVPQTRTSCCNSSVAITAEFCHCNCCYVQNQFLLSLSSFNWQLSMSIMEVFLWQAWNESQWTVLLGYLTGSKILAAIKHIGSAVEIILLFRKTAIHFILHATLTVHLLQQICCSWVMAANNLVLTSEPYWLQDFETYDAVWAKVVSQQDWKKQAATGRSLGKQ